MLFFGGFCADFRIQTAVAAQSYRRGLRPALLEPKFDACSLLPGWGLGDSNATELESPLTRGGNKGRSCHHPVTVGRFMGARTVLSLDWLYSVF